MAGFKYDSCVEAVMESISADDDLREADSTTSLPEALDQLLGSVLPQEGEPRGSLRSLAKARGYTIVADATSEELARSDLIVVPQHFSEREANYRIARALVWPKLQNALAHWPDGEEPVSENPILSDLLANASQDHLLDIFAAALLIPSDEFLGLPVYVRHDARELADWFSIPLHLAVERAGNFGLVPA